MCIYFDTEIIDKSNELAEWEETVLKIRNMF